MVDIKWTQSKIVWINLGKALLGILVAVYGAFEAFDKNPVFLSNLIKWLSDANLEIAAGVLVTIFSILTIVFRIKTKREIVPKSVLKNIDTNGKEHKENPV